MNNLTLSPEALENDESIGVPLTPIKQIHIDHEFNCRGHFSPMTCVELAKDVARRGLQQPITIRPLREDDDVENLLMREKNFTHVIIAGHRRFTAYKILNAERIPTIIKPADLDRFEAKDLNAIENLQREELNLQQECMAIKHYWMADWTREDVAQRIGKSGGWVQTRYMLLNMPQEIQDLAGQGYVKAGDLRDLYKIKDPTRQIKAAAMLRDARRDGRGSATQILNKVKPKDSVTTKKQRGRQEIFDFMDIVRAALADYDLTTVPATKLVTAEGNCFATRCLAWASGQVTTGEIHADLQEFAALVGKEYEMPELSLDV